MINGKILRDAFISGANSISNQKTAVDELNVFPVPDGDTGTNMSMTMGNALIALEKMHDDVTVSEVAEQTASALLRGARGNSGVILSLIFRGFSKGFSGKKEASIKDFVSALDQGVSGAYKSIMKPTEGTILTVARLASERAAAVSVSVEDEVSLWEEACTAASEALEDTPNLLPALKKAGVVDAGGKGLLIIFEAMLNVFKGGEVVKTDTPTEKKAVTIDTFSSTVGDYDEVINFTYCTEMLISKADGSDDCSKLRAYLETIGDCVVVVDDDDIIKVHVHTNNPGKAIERALKFGTINLPKIENMKMQHEQRIIDAKVPEIKPVKPEKEFGFVAVAAGHGVEALFEDIGVDCIVRGGQTMNPSTEDILAAINKCPSEIVFVLPNNKNIIMSAEQAGKLADRKVCVLQTRTIPQGMSAMLAFDEEADFETNRLEMTHALERVSTGQITFAARDSDFEGHKIKQNEILALDNGKLSFVDKDVAKAAFKLIKKLVKSDTSYITIIQGSDVSDEDANALKEQVESKYQNAEVLLVNGGQPVYYYILSAE